jgi:Uma2 family endonuclease
MDSTLLQQIAVGNAPALMRLTVEQYHQIAEAGVFPDGSPVELLDGVLVLKDRRDAEGDPMVVGPRHAIVVKKIDRVIDTLVEAHGCHSRCQLPITLPPHHEPEPDVAVVIGDIDDYAEQHPGPDEVVLVVEVAHSSLRHDRDTKQRIYAEAVIPAYWIIDLAARRIECYSQPLSDEGRYGELHTFDDDDTISLSLPDGSTLDIPAADLLPR